MRRGQMNTVEFSPEDRQRAIARLQDYFEQELDRELGSFEAGFLLDFISKELGAAFYNQGLYDARAVLSGKMDDLSEAILGLEKRVS